MTRSSWPAALVLAGILLSGCSRPASDETKKVDPPEPAKVEPAKVETAKVEATPPVAAPKPAPYVHMVFYRLKKDAPPDAADGLVTGGNELLKPIPAVRHFQIGRRADKAPEYAFKDYHVGLVALFDDYDGLKVFLDHPKHNEFLTKHGKHLDSLLVYDFVEPKK